MSKINKRNSVCQRMLVDTTYLFNVYTYVHLERSLQMSILSSLFIFTECDIDCTVHIQEQ